MSRSFVEELRAGSGSLGERPTLTWDGGSLTWRELNSRADGVAARLAARGVVPGDRLALTIGNTPEFLVALLAGWQLGVTVAPLDTLLKEDERATILGDLSPAAVLDAADVSDPAGRGSGEERDHGRPRRRPLHEARRRRGP